MTVEIKTKKILCIDDDAALLKVVHRILSKNFPPEVLEIHEANNGEQGIKMIQALHPDIVLSDIQMPQMDGLEICRRVRQHGIQTAIILMSAYDVEEDNAIKASKAGADAFLSKPIKKGELLFAVNFVLRIASLSEAVTTKNKQLEKSVEQLKQYQQKLNGLNEELKSDKRRLNENLKEVVTLNKQLESKNGQILSMNEELAGRFESTVSLISNIIELHQSEHRGHAERVAEISVYIAKKIDLPDQQIQNIKTSALIHELGIVSLPDEKKIEEATDELSNRSFTHHPLVAEMLLKSFPGFELVSNIIRHLHENVDGSGIPDNLSGDRIPIGSRIVSLASYFDHALISGGQDKLEQAFAKVEDQAGLMFDEKLVGVLSDWIDEQNPEKISTVDYNIFALKEGMELASDIYSESGINLLRKGTVLKKDILSRVLKFHNVDPILGSIKVKRK
ncbi:MAG: response regulator [Candidatus Nitronauta litoralis]|uniref:Response regulator n=1 Tax=Candidatus Nitronauta litoralis TaxID=2705533 RepID=A0A7T0BXI1_9BACT|nr:MAG: response regulator [Candidatus Nitronauta litoralis]